MNLLPRITTKLTQVPVLPSHQDFQSYNSQTFLYFVSTIRKMTKNYPTSVVFLRKHTD